MCCRRLPPKSRGGGGIRVGFRIGILCGLGECEFAGIRAELTFPLPYFFTTLLFPHLLSTLFLTLLLQM